MSLSLPELYRFVSVDSPGQSRRSRRTVSRRQPSLARGHISGRGSRRLANKLRRLKELLRQLVNSAWVLSAPFFLLLTVASTDFLILTTGGGFTESLFFDELGGGAFETGREAAEAVKGQVFKLIYFLVMLLVVLHLKTIFTYFKQWPHLYWLLAYLLITAAFSIVPVKVLTNTIIILVGFLAAILFAVANARQERYYVLFTCVFLSMLLLHIVSAWIFWEQGENLIEFLSSSRRYGGLAGNPNSLGATAVIGYWAAACLVLSSAVGRWFRVLAIAGIALFGLHIALSGSGTSLASVLLITLVIFWFRVISLLKPLTRSVINIVLVFGLSCLLMLILIFSTPGELYLAFTESLGKDATMTGRTELWTIAREAMSIRPFFGWGFDSHTSVMSERLYRVDFNHYHNGYLDTVIAGGVFLLMFVLYNITRFSLAFRAAFVDKPMLYPLIVPLIMLLFLNISEYSLLRPNSPIWAIYVVSFVLLTFHKDESASVATNKSKYNYSYGSRQKRYRWG